MRLDGLRAVAGMTKLTCRCRGVPGLRGSRKAPVSRTVPRAGQWPEGDSGNDQGREFLQQQINSTISKIRDGVEGNTGTLLSLCMQLSLESEFSARPSPLNSTDLSKTTWSLQNIKSMADQVQTSFLHAVRQEYRGEQDAKGYQELVTRHPTTLISTINSVMFEYHGYKRMSSWGDSDAFSFARVLESGSGSPLAIAILYQAVAAQSGLPLDCTVLEDGDYAILHSRSILGEMWCVDPYSKGMLMSADEVSELFDVALPLSGASPREIAIAVIKQLMYVSWGEITNVFEPAFRLPIDGEDLLNLALGSFEDVSFSYGSGSEEEDVSSFFVIEDTRGQHLLSNCVSAAEKLRSLERNSVASRSRLAVLLYFNKKYAEAKGVLNELILDSDTEESLKERISLLMNKCILMETL
jgi:hypothetical protein